jgi:hypothetical protein
MGIFLVALDNIYLLVCRHTGGLMRLTPFVMVILVFSVSWARADDNVFNSATALKEEVMRFGDEGLEVVKTPLDLKHGGFIGTLAAAGAVGLTYVFDNDIRNKTLGTKSRTLDRATDAGEIIGNPYVHLGAAAVVYGGGILAGSPKWRELGEMLGEAALLADATGFILREFIGRARPSIKGDKGNFRPFQFRSDYESMPSLHAASSFAMASVLASTSDKLLTKTLFYSVAAFVGFSRMYQDKHWAGDVVLGAVIGELCGRVVTGFHASRVNISLVPVISGGSASLAVEGNW